MTKEAAGELRSIMSGVAALPWEGMTKRAFAGRFASLTGKLGHMGSAYESVGGALDRYATELASIQQQVQRREAERANAQATMVREESLRVSAANQARLTELRLAKLRAQSVLLIADPVGQQNNANAQRAERATLAQQRATASRHASAHNRAEGDWTRALGVLANLREALSEAVRTCVAAIRNADLEVTSGVKRFFGRLGRAAGRMLGRGFKLALRLGGALLRPIGLVLGPPAAFLSRQIPERWKQFVGDWLGAAGTRLVQVLGATPIALVLGPAPLLLSLPGGNITIADIGRLVSRENDAKRELTLGYVLPTESKAKSLGDDAREIADLGNSPTSPQVRIIEVPGTNPPKYRILIAGIRGFPDVAPEWAGGDDAQGAAANTMGDSAFTREVRKQLMEFFKEHGVTNAQVELVGHSNGGSTAMALASQGLGPGIDVTHVVTMGSPISRIRVPDGIQVMEMNNRDDAVPDLDYAESRPTDSHIVDDFGQTSPKAHDIDNVYAPHADWIEQHGTKQQRAYLESIEGYYTDQPCQSYDMRIDSVPASK